MRDTPKILYHYTTAQGLLGILRSNVLWATSLRYMNDLSELKYTVHLITDELTKAVEADTQMAELLLAFPHEESMTQFSAYALCFCVDGDQLSQWRAYAEKGTGYALGFDFERLRGDSTDGFMSKILYDRDDQISLIRPLLAKYIDDFKSYAKNLNTLDQNRRREQLMSFLPDFTGKALLHAFSFKDSVFSEEKEWRRLSMKASSDIEGLYFREVRGTIVPYVEMKIPSLKPDSELLPIVEVIQGPLIDPSLGERSLRLLLKKYGYFDVQVRRSKVPIRF